MTITQFLLIVILSIAICFYIYLIFCGLYRTVIIERNKLSLLANPTNMVYKFIRGPHKEWHKAFNQLTKMQANCKSFGIFYDNPQEVASEDCRSIIGILTDDNEIDNEIMDKLIDGGYLKGSFPSIQSAVYVKFPINNYVSVILGIRKIYPLMNAYIRQFKLNAYPFIEFYDKNNLYIATPLDNQDKFYVPEYHQTGQKKDD
ncbi:Testis-expressed sequence 264 protein [Trichoplax sp. H2]|nr:Testis-expressed sequence 264 protein [Trichoplax sp. H2]|eukprot:RDD45446.1 Testis-expressed sequence 264 protein [Trichoplax sp. H2]